MVRRCAGHKVTVERADQARRDGEAYRSAMNADPTDEPHELEVEFCVV
jgi:hypothetical protein